jgi:beta-glucosidase
MRFTFPEDFLFGAACSACQIESGCREGGKGEDVGEHFFRLLPEKYFGADPNDSADFYHRYRSDIGLMKELGLNAFRFSISWSRIYPAGPEAVCQAGIDYYSDMIDALKEAGIVTFFDLFHCDLPYWVIEKGGILNPEFIDWFAVYAETCFRAFGDRVDYWSTVNEPSINCMGAYAYGSNAPYLKDMSLAIRACHNMILAHYRAVRIYRSLGLSGKISAVIHFEPNYSLSFDPKDDEAAERNMAFYSGWWLEPFLEGHYPAELVTRPYLREKLPEHFAEELAENFAGVDFIGINYYNPGHARYREDGEMDLETFSNTKLPQDDYGFWQYPAGLLDSLLFLRDRYPGKEIYITENGVAKKKWGSFEEERRDEYRIDYMREHLRMISRAAKAGVPVKGYFTWTIMDTNELYAGGYDYIFGLLQVDYKTKERFPRDSYGWYRQVIARREVD